MSEELGTLTILDESGDKSVHWKRIKAWYAKLSKEQQETYHKELGIIMNPPEPEDIKEARLAFEAKQKQGYDSYELDKPGDISSGRKITKFNPDAKFIVQCPKLSAGK
jgi:hypothetical protein